MSYTRHYIGARTKEDENALRDIQEYLGEERWLKLVTYVSTGLININEINGLLAFAGVRGYPFHAFCRRYALARYREWMASEPDPIMTDEQGFTIEVEDGVDRGNFIGPRVNEEMSK